MFRTLALPALLALSIAAGGVAAQEQAPAPQLGLEQRMLLRCSAAFALAARAQESGDAQALQWPALGDRGREFFVTAVVRVMDQAALDRAQVTAALTAEADDIVANGTLAQVVPVCLDLLPPEQ